MGEFNSGGVSPRSVVAADFDMATATKADANDFRRSLEARELAPNTISRRISRAKQFWKAAVDAELVNSNPFAGQSCTVRPVESRFHYVDRETTQRLIDAAPCSDWRLILALTRYAGLRCPSEVLSLTWDCVDFEASRIKVFSPKLEAHANGGWRTIPLFSELRPYLEAVRSEAGDSDRVITRYKSCDANLRTTFEKICNRAGVDKYPKPFVNMRSSAAIDLNDGYPQHVVAEWLGHSENVAVKFYLRSKDEHFRKATQNPTQLLHDVTQNPTQQVAAADGTEQQTVPETGSFTEELRLDAATCRSVPTREAPPVGLEPTTRRLTAACSTN